MANKDIVDGLKPWGDCVRSNRYLVGGTIYPGDALKFDAAGKVVVATATDALMGVALEYATTSVNTRVLVADHPDQLFTCQADDNSIAAQTDINLNCDLIFGSPDTTYRRSGVEIDASTKNTTATLTVKVLEIVPAADNAFGTNAKCICKINNHQLGQSTGTAGV